MEAPWYTSIPGIIAGTIIIVEVIKRALGNVALAKQIPTWVYVVVIGVGLTYAARAAGLLVAEGSDFAVLMDALEKAAAAAGFWTWFRNPKDKLEDSAPALKADPFRGLPIVLLAVALAGAFGCGKNMAPQLVAAEDAVHDGLADAQDRIDKVCATGAAPIACKEINAALVPALKAGAQFNRAVREQSLDAAGGIVEAIGALIRKVQSLAAGELRDAIVADLRRAVDAAFAIAGGVR